MGFLSEVITMVFVRSSEALNKISVCELFELGRPAVRLKRFWTVISFIFFEELTKTIILSAVFKNTAI